MKDEQAEKGIRLKPLEIAMPPFFHVEICHHLIEIRFLFYVILLYSVVLLRGDIIILNINNDYPEWWIR